MQDIYTANLTFKAGKQLEDVIAAALRTNTKIGLVKDEGIYLVAGSIGRIRVAYADRFDPKLDCNVWDRARELVGGDDFVERIDISTKDLAHMGRLASRGFSLLIRLTESDMTLAMFGPDA